LLLIKNYIMTKQVIGIISLFAISLTTFAQKKTPPKSTPKVVVKSSPLKTLEDSANYALGLSVVNFFSKQQGIQKINTDLLSMAINDALAGKKLLLDDNQVNMVLTTYLQQVQVAKAKPNIAACQNFLAQNKSKPGVTTTASGLQYEVITLGTGPKPTLTDTVIVHYKGTLLNGNPVDDSYSRGQPIEFALTGVIRGWTEVLQLMPAGSKYKVYIPYDLGYGSSDYNHIPGGSLLIFDIELLQVKGKS
jgi:FKBP-type peptidyl-prolyl cis-trans isomerase